MTPPRKDPELRGPAQLSTPRVAVVRLNRRVLYVVGGTLVVVVVAGLIALRAQSARLGHPESPAGAAHLVPSAGGRWFDKVPDRESSGPPTAATPPVIAPVAPPVSTPAPAKAPSEAELEA